MAVPFSTWWRVAKRLRTIGDELNKIIIEREQSLYFQLGSTGDAIEDSTVVSLHTILADLHRLEEYGIGQEESQ